MKKSISVLLILSLLSTLLLCFSACKEDDEPSAPSGVTDVELVSNGLATYSIVYPDSVGDELFFAISELAEAIQKSTGAKIDYVKSSWIGSAKAGNYIYVGDTGSAESNAAIAKLPAFVDAYAIALEGNHVTISGRYEATLCTAVKYFKDNLIAKNYNAETKTLLLEEYAFAGVDPLPTAFEKANLEKYVIVYPIGDDGYLELALTMRDQIESFTGTQLKVRSSAHALQPYEILIGETGRPTSQKAFAQRFDVMESYVYVEKGQLQLVAGGHYSAKRGIDELMKIFLRSSKVESLAEGIHLENDLIPITHTITEGSDVRIMTLNVLADYVVEAKDQEALPVEMRAEIFAGMLITHTPDLIGLQEFDTAWVELLNGFLPILKEKYGLDYRLVLERHETHESCSPILYNAARFKCDYTECHPYEYKVISSPTARLVRVAGVAKFTSLSDPANEIVLFTSHWDHTSEENMNACATEEAALVKKYEAKYPNARVFCTGDFNSHKFSGKYLSQFVAEINGAIASNLARTSGTLITDGGYHASGFIDHIIGRKDSYSVLYHDTLLINSYDKMTDHAPIYADIQFK